MKRILPLAFVLGATASGLFFVALSAGVGQTESGGLPGARATVQAAHYPSIQAAINALPVEGGMVRLPAGVFEIEKPLTVRVGDVCIEGAGTATHIKNINEAGKPALVVAHPEVEADPKNNRLWRVRLANFRITGNPKSGHGIIADRVNEVFIDGVTVSEHGGDGIRLDYCYEDPRVCNSLITYNKAVGLNLLGCHDIVVSANQFEENQDALHCIDAFNLCMTGNCLDDHLARGVLIENTYGSVVSGNMIEECQAAAITLDRDCYGITLSANVIAHNGGGVILNDAHGCAVSANTFTINKTDAVRIGPGAGRIALTGNSFSNSYLGEGKIRRGSDDLNAAGIVLEGTSHIVVTGNQFASLRPKALATGETPSSRVIFSNNEITDAESEHKKLTDSLVEGNLVP